jgi:hypothetical protein
MRSPASSKARAVLTKEQVIDIFRLSQILLPDRAKLSPTYVAEIFGVSEKTIRNIWSGRTWYNDTLPLDAARTPKRLVKLGRPLGRKDSAPRRCRKATNDSGAELTPDPEGAMLEGIHDRSRIDVKALIDKLSVSTSFTFAEQIIRKYRSNLGSLISTRKSTQWENRKECSSSIPTEIGCFGENSRQQNNINSAFIPLPALTTRLQDVGLGSSISREREPQYLPSILPSATHINQPTSWTMSSPPLPLVANPNLVLPSFTVLPPIRSLPAAPESGRPMLPRLDSHSANADNLVLTSITALSPLAAPNLAAVTSSAGHFASVAAGPAAASSWHWQADGTTWSQLPGLLPPSPPGGRVLPPIICSQPWLRG